MIQLALLVLICPLILIMVALWGGARRGNNSKNLFIEKTKKEKGKTELK